MSLTNQITISPVSGVAPYYAAPGALTVAANGGSVTVSSVVKDSGGADVGIPISTFAEDGAHLIERANLRLKIEATGGAEYEWVAA